MTIISTQFAPFAGLAKFRPGTGSCASPVGVLYQHRAGESKLSRPSRSPPSYGSQRRHDRGRVGRPAARPLWRRGTYPVQARPRLARQGRAPAPPSLAPRQAGRAAEARPETGSFQDSGNRLRCHAGARLEGLGLGRRMVVCAGPFSPP